MRLSESEKEAIKFALKNFKGRVLLFGSRLNDSGRGGDIDILLIPEEQKKGLDLSLDVQKRFFSKCEEKIDVIIYSDTPFCREVLKDAQELDVTRI